MTSRSDEELRATKPRAGTWLAVGAAAGVAFGAAVDQLALGLAIGGAIGAVLDVISHLRFRNRQ
jgi:uncharacterized membrane protein